jgi:multidrug efflux pump subunit AcrB
MKKTIDEKLNDIFDVDESTGKVIVPQQPETPVTNNATIDDDYEYARNNLRGLIENGKDIMQNLTFVAKESESPRSYEVVGQLIKTLAETNKDLLELAKKSKDLKSEEKQSGGGDTNINALFVGSTTELQNLLNNKK